MFWKHGKSKFFSFRLTIQHLNICLISAFCFVDRSMMIDTYLKEVKRETPEECVKKRGVKKETLQDCTKKMWR